MTALARPDRQCGATSRSGERCGNYAMRGGRVCRMHGGSSPQARGAAERRVALAQALAADPRRDPGDVLSDVLHQADHLMRKARDEVRADRPTAVTMTRLMDLTEQAGRWAKTTLDAGVAERQTRALEGQAQALAGVIGRILDRLGLSPEQQALVYDVVPEELERLSPAALESAP